MCSCVLEAKSISVLYKHLVTYPFHFWISRIFRFDHWDPWDPWTMQHEAFCSAARASMLSAPLRGSCQRRCMCGKQNTTDHYRELRNYTCEKKHQSSSIIIFNHLKSISIIMQKLSSECPHECALCFEWISWSLLDSPIWGATGNHRARHVPGHDSDRKPLWFMPIWVIILSFLVFLHGFSWHSPLHASSWWSWCNPMMNPICINPQKMHRKGTKMHKPHDLPVRSLAAERRHTGHLSAGRPVEGSLVSRRQVILDCQPMPMLTLCYEWAPQFLNRFTDSWCPDVLFASLNMSQLYGATSTRSQNIKSIH